jgi:hypothetical protein
MRVKRNVWTSPFGLAFIIGSIAALIAGYFAGAGMSGGETNMALANYNMAADNFAEAYPDENALIAANREPSAPPPAPQAAPPPSVAAPAPTPTPAPVTEEVAPPDDEPVPVERPRTRDRRDRRAEPPPEDLPEENPDGPR